MLLPPWRSKFRIPVANFTINILNMQHFDKNKVDKLLKTLGKVVRKTQK